VSSDAQYVSALPYRYYGSVGTKACWIHSDHDGRGLVGYSGTFHCLVNQRVSDELVVARVGELTVDFNVRGAGVGAILVNDLLVDGLIRAFDGAGIDNFISPKVSLGVKTLIKVTRVTTGVAEAQPKAIRGIFRKKARCN
jgi:hypothetical protein